MEPSYKYKYRNMTKCEELEARFAVLSEIAKLAELTDEQRYVLSFILSELDYEIFNCED